MKINPVTLNACSSCDMSWIQASSVNKANDLFNKINGISVNKQNIFQFTSPAIFTPQEEIIQDYAYVNTFLQYGNEVIKNLAMEIVNPSDSDDVKMQKIQRWVVYNIEYMEDEEQYGYSELWVPPTMLLKTKKGDCVANYEEIWTKNGLKKVGDLKIGDIILSYDFDKKEYCYKPITKIWEKGELDVFRVTFRNGTWIDVTEDHPFWTRRTQQYSDYEKTKLHDIDLTKWWKRKIPCVKKLPYEIKDIEWLTEDLCFVIGHFLAEGWVDKSHVCTSGYDILDSIIPILDNYEIPYSFFKNNCDVPCIRFLKSFFKDYLKQLKNNDIEIFINDEIFYLPENKLQSLLDGIFIGDGNYSKYKDKRGNWKNNKEKTYSTISDQLAFDIQRIHLQLGKPIHIWLQTDHKGLGNNSIWRLSYNSNSHFSKDFGYDNISEVSIKNIEPLGQTQTRDFEVEDTHTFINKFGNLCHNCEDGAFLIISLALNSGVDPNKLRFYAGTVKAGEGAATGGHGWAAYKRDSDKKWVVVDYSYYPDLREMDKRIPMSKDDRYIDDYFIFEIGKVVITTGTNRVREPEIYNNIGNIKPNILLTGTYISQYA